MTRLFGLAFVGAWCIGMFLLLSGQPVVAQAPAITAKKFNNCEIICPPPNLGFNDIKCAGVSHRAASLETESGTNTWMCTQEATLANYQQVCKKRCVSCNNGSQFIINNAETFAGGEATHKCISAGTNDAGVSWAFEGAQ